MTFRSCTHTFIFVGTMGFSLSAQAFESTSAFDCDTPERFSEWSSTVPAGQVQLQGVLSINDLRVGSTWTSSANMVIGNAGNKVQVGLRLAVFGEHPDILQVMLSTGDPEKLIKLGVLPWRGKKLPFKVRLTREGQLLVELSAISTSQQLRGFSPGGVSLACSSGDFSFKEIRISSPAP
jgi:hypothetical protein